MDEENKGIFQRSLGAITIRDNNINKKNDRNDDNINRMNNGIITMNPFRAQLSLDTKQLNQAETNLIFKYDSSSPLVVQYKGLLHDTDLQLLRNNSCYLLLYLG